MLAVGLLADDAPRNTGPDFGKASPFGLIVVVLLLIGSTAGLLARLKSNQKLGSPGVKTAPLPDSKFKNLEVLLPERVLDYTSQVITQQALVLAVLP